MTKIIPLLILFIAISSFNMDKGAYLKDKGAYQIYNFNDDVILVDSCVPNSICWFDTFYIYGSFANDTVDSIIKGENSLTIVQMTDSIITCVYDDNTDTGYVNLVVTDGENYYTCVNCLYVRDCQTDSKPTITSVSPSSPRLFKTFEAAGTNLSNCKLYLNSVSLGTPTSATSTTISDTALGTTRGFHWLIAEDTLTGMRCSTSSRIYIKNTQLDTVLLGRP